MLRASAVCEAAGYPTSSLTCEGFLRQAAATSIGLGMANIPVALVPGHIGNKSAEQLRRDILEVTTRAVIDNLTVTPATKGDTSEPGARDIVVTGGFKEVNRYFYEHEYSDGLPIVPPTRDDIEAFLRFTNRGADEVLGVLLPDKRAATVWSIAVNGVMAGCKPEYMPILVALIEAMCDPEYGVEHSGNTPGADTLIILNGPIIKELGFNYTQGALRDGIMANTAIGRFWRLYLRNVAGFLPHKTDKATFGNTWRVVLAENEDVLKEIGWEPNSVEMGFAAGDNTVTIARYTGGGALSSVSGSTPEQMLPYLADSVLRFNNWQITFTTSHGNGMLRPLVVVSPIIAETIARAGWSKAQVKRYLYEHARLPAWEFERQLRDWNIRGVWDLKDDVTAGRIPKVFYESDDPNRLVPIVWEPEDYMIAVSGDPLRNNAYVFAHNGFLGYPVGKKIELPKNWNKLLANANV
ncbi:MAG TPA: UGSC family (seleno)protein [Burkholderiales bacterium]|nr:UGSC family (seleno)protein [Burkholderiales bacterium]